MLLLILPSAKIAGKYHQNVSVITALMRGSWIRVIFIGLRPACITGIWWMLWYVGMNETSDRSTIPRALLNIVKSILCSDQANWFDVPLSTPDSMLSVPSPRSQIQYSNEGRCSTEGQKGKRWYSRCTTPQGPASGIENRISQLCERKHGKLWCNVEYDYAPLRTFRNQSRHVRVLQRIVVGEEYSEDHT